MRFFCFKKYAIVKYSVWVIHMYHVGYFLQHKLFSNQLRQLYFFIGFLSFASSMVGLFIPLYLYLEVGFAFQNVMLFFIIENVFFALCTPIAADFLVRKGVKHTILFGIPIKCFVILLFYSLPRFPSLLVFTAIFGGLYQAFLWLGVHMLFKHVTHKNKRGKELGMRIFIGRIAAIVGPIVGGGIIHLFGFYMLFIAMLGCVMVASLCLLANGEYAPKYVFSWGAVRKNIQWKYGVFFLSQGIIQTGQAIAWPLFIFFILGNYVSLGVAGSVFTFITAIIVLVAGKYSDVFGKRRYIRRFLPFEIASWVARFFVRTTTQVYGVIFFAGSTLGLLAAPVGALEYDNAPKNALAYFVQREFFIASGRIVLLAFLLFTENYTGSFLLVAFVELAILLF